MLATAARQRSLRAGGQPHQEPRHVAPAFRLGQFLRIEPDDVGAILGKDLGEAGDQAELVAALDLDAVGDPRHRTGQRVEGIGDDPDLRALELGQEGEPVPQARRVEPLGQLDDRGELGALAQRGEGGVAQIDAVQEEMVGHRRHQPDLVAAENGDERHRHAGYQFRLGGRA